MQLIVLFALKNQELIYSVVQIRALNYNPNANVDDGSCDFYSQCPILDFSYVITDVNMTLLFNSEFVQSHDIQIGQMIGVFANTEDDQTPICYGSAEWTGDQFSMAVWGDDVTTPEEDGFQLGDTIKIGYQLISGTILSLESYDIEFIPGAINFISTGTFSEVCSSSLFSILGCTNPNYVEFEFEANVDDYSCQELIVYGCTDILALNYNPDANINDGSCNFDVFGCTDTLAINYNPNATIDNESCNYEYSGCIFPNQFTGNTGVNMTVFLTSDFVGNLPITSASPYLVASTNLGLVVGSASLDLKIL